MKAIVFALIVTGLLVFTSYRAMTFEPDAAVAPIYGDYGQYAASPRVFTGPWTATTGRGCSALSAESGVGLNHSPILYSPL